MALEEPTPPPKDYIHLRNIDRKPKNPDAFINPFQSCIYFSQGNRNSGKSSFDEVIAEEHYRAGHTILDLHSAGNYESLYWCISHNCQDFWTKWRE